MCWPTGVRTASLRASLGKDHMIDLRPHYDWVTLNKSFYLLWGLSFLICEMEMITSHRTAMRIRDEVNVHSACRTAGFGQKAALILSIIITDFPGPIPKTALQCPLLSFGPAYSLWPWLQQPLL